MPEPDEKLTEIMAKLNEKAKEINYGEMTVRFKIHNGKVVGAITSPKDWEYKLG